MVTGTVRGATVDPSDAGPGVLLLRQLGPLGLIIEGLIRLYKGHAAEFLYTYIVGGKYYAGKCRKFVSDGQQEPKLFGRSRGEAILVRYDPEKPTVSMVRAQDNLPKG